MPGPITPFDKGAADGVLDAGDSVAELLTTAWGPIAGLIPVPMADTAETSTAGAGAELATMPEVVADGTADGGAATLRSDPDPFPETIGVSGALGVVDPSPEEVPALAVGLELLP